VFVACFFGLLVADWAHWSELAGAVFFMASSLTAYYVRPSGLLPVVVSPPLLFFVACAAEKMLTSSGPSAAFEATVAALAGVAGWLLAGTGLSVVIALLRGLPSQVRALILSLRSLSRGPGHAARTPPDRLPRTPLERPQLRNRVPASDPNCAIEAAGVISGVRAGAGTPCAP